MVVKAIEVVDGMEPLGQRIDTIQSERQRDPLRNYNDGQKIVLRDVPIDPLDNSLGGESISGHFIAALIVTGENPTNLAGLNFELDGTNNLLASLLPCKRSITTIVFACRKPPSYVPYKRTYVPYDGTFGAPDQGQTLDV